MRVLLVTPAADADAPGNRVTAERWAGFLRELGHQVEVREAYEPGPRFDLLVALHARKSRDSVLRFDEARKGGGGGGAGGAEGVAPRLVVALTGTDLYRDLEDLDAPAWDSVRRADRLVVLQERGPEMLPPALREKTRVIYQSVPELWERDPDGAGGAPVDERRADIGRRAGGGSQRALEVCMLAHLRPVKDPLLAAEAASRLPEGSRVRIHHYGAAYSEELAGQVREASGRSPRYEWHGELSRAEALRRLAESDLMLLTSRLEGAGNATSEAITARVPILCTRVSGLVGMVGRDYAGLFEPGDADGLARLLRRAETDEGFLAALRRHVGERRPLLDPDREREAWAELLRELDLTDRVAPDPIDR